MIFELCVDHHVGIVFLETGSVVHQVDHADRLVISEVCKETLRKVRSDISLKIDLALLPELHDTDPDHSLCR